MTAHAFNHAFNLIARFQSDRAVAPRQRVVKVKPTRTTGETVNLGKVGIKLLPVAGELLTLQKQV